MLDLYPQSAFRNPQYGLWHAFWSRMGTLEKHWLWSDPLVARGLLSQLENGHTSILPSSQNIAPDVSSILLPDDPRFNLSNFFKERSKKTIMIVSFRWKMSLSFYWQNIILKFPGIPTSSVLI